MGAIAEWFERERGIRPETLAAFGVHGRGDRVVFPYSNGEKERPDPTRPLKEGERRFYFTQGRQPDLFQPPVQPGSTTAFLCEGETDTMRLWQELGGQYDVYGIGGINTWREEHSHYLRPYARVVVFLDNDQDYMVKGQVDTAWRKIRHDIGSTVKRCHLPHDVKDVCEFFDRYDVDTLNLLLERREASRYRPVDFTKTPPPVEWLLEGWIAKGDVTVLAGVGGLGKSLVAQALAMAVIRGDTEFLGQAVKAHGPAMLVDEENPEDVVYSRMLRFGLDPTTQGGLLRYLWNEGIRLDRDPDTLYEEVVDFRPALLSLDSLSRLHGGDENAQGEIGRVINDAVKPLARDSGAGVILIHHHDKAGQGPRGSGDIVNAADAVINVFPVPAQPTQFTLRLDKSRRTMRGAEIRVGITDTPSGGLELVASPAFDVASLTF